MLVKLEIFTFDFDALFAIFVTIGYLLAGGRGKLIQPLKGAAGDFNRSINIVILGSRL